MKKSIIVLFIVGILSSCASMQKLAVNQFAKSLGQDEGGALNAFMKDDDPQLVAEALPSIMKMMESMAEISPENPDLQYSCGMMYIMYSTAFLQIPASMEDNYRQQQVMQKRAKNLYKRGLDYLLEAFNLKYPGFRAFVEGGKIDQALSMVTVEDAEWLYWAGAGWMGYYATDPMDLAVGTNAYKGVALLMGSIRLDENVADGGAHDVMVQLYATLPELAITALIKAPELGRYYDAYYKLAEVSDDAMERAKLHYDLSIEASAGLQPGPYMAYATSISVKEQNIVEFKLMMQRILDLDPYKDERQTLLITIYQNKAVWLLDNIDDYFVVTD